MGYTSADYPSADEEARVALATFIPTPAGALASQLQDCFSAPMGGKSALGDQVLVVL